MNGKVLECKNCGNEFVYSVEEQNLYKDRGIDDPEYCAICRGIFEAKQRDEERRKK